MRKTGASKSSGPPVGICYCKLDLRGLSGFVALNGQHGVAQGQQRATPGERDDKLSIILCRSYIRFRIKSQGPGQQVIGHAALTGRHTSFFFWRHNPMVALRLPWATLSSPSGAQTQTVQCRRGNRKHFVVTQPRKSASRALIPTFLTPPHCLCLYDTASFVGMTGSQTRSLTS